MAKLILKKSSVIENGIPKAPVANDLDYGELAINYAAGVLYYKKSDNTVSDLVNYTPKIISATTGTTTIDFLSAYNFHITLQTNTQFVLSNISARIGSSGNIVIIQDSTGGRTFTKAAEMKTPIGGAAIDQWTTANSLSLLTYYIVSSNNVIINYIGNFA